MNYFVGGESRVNVFAVGDQQAVVSVALSGGGYVSIWQSNDAKAGQEVWHLHYHVLPRVQEDELRGFYPRPPKSFTCSVVWCSTYSAC